MDGFSVLNAIQRIDLGGRDITEYLMLLLKRAGYPGLHTSADFQIVKTIKEKFCKCSSIPLKEDFFLSPPKEK